MFNRFCKILVRQYSSKMVSGPFRSSAEDFLSFVDASPTPFHAVKCVKERLAKAGFQEVKEKESWSSTCKAGGKYYLTRNGSTIVAFAIGKKWKPGNPLAMIGAHTDSPCLRVKPVSKKQADGFLQIGVETYGGGLWHTWFDRDLGLAGRAMIRSPDGTITTKLINVNKPSKYASNQRASPISNEVPPSSTHSDTGGPSRSAGDLLFQQRNAIISDRWSRCCRAKEE